MMTVDIGFQHSCGDESACTDGDHMIERIPVGLNLTCDFLDCLMDLIVRKEELFHDAG